MSAAPKYRKFFDKAQVFISFNWSDTSTALEMCVEFAADDNLVTEIPGYFPPDVTSDAERIAFIDAQK